MVVGGQRHTPAALPPGKTRYPLYKRLGGPQGQSGRVRKISPSPVFDPRTVQPVASCYADWAISPHTTADPIPLATPRLSILPSVSHSLLILYMSGFLSDNRRPNVFFAVGKLWSGAWVAECRAKTKFWPSSWTDSSKYLPVAAATLRLVKQWRSFQHDKPRWYRWINSIIALSFSVTTLSASLTNCPDKFRRNLTQQVTAYHSAANSFSKFHKPAVRDNTVIYIYIEREREREGGTRNVIPLIVHITHFYCYKSIWHLVQN